MIRISNADRADTRVLQFGTRSLLVGTALCAVFVLVLQHLGAVWGMAVVWFLVLVAAHVLANVRGAHKSREVTALGEADIAGVGVSPLPTPMEVARACAPATQLRDQRRFGRVLLIATAATAFVASIVATAALVLATRADAGGIVLGGVSAAVLGGLLGFVSASFAMVATGSFREAADERRSAPASRAARSA